MCSSVLRTSSKGNIIKTKNPINDECRKSAGRVGSTFATAPVLTATNIDIAIGKVNCWKISSGREVHQVNRKVWRTAREKNNKARERERGSTQHPASFNVHCAHCIERMKVPTLFDNLETMTVINVYKELLWKCQDPYSNHHEHVTTTWTRPQPDLAEECHSPETARRRRQRQGYRERVVQSPTTITRAKK